MGELYDKLAAYGESDYYPCHMPGHKRRLKGRLPEELIKADITEIEGFDNLHEPKELIKELQEKAARMYGAEESFFLINGSTAGILSAISAALPFGGHILMARNSHKSAYHAAYLRQLKISYLYPRQLDGYFVCDGISPKQVREALEQDMPEPGTGAVFIVSPTYEGRIANVQEIARVVHEKGLILMVDEAHGAHLGLAEGFPMNSNQAGADIVIHSIHKTLPALTQTALLHVNGDRVDRERLRRFLHIYQSSSPSYLLMASIDNALDLIEREGKSLFRQFYVHYAEMLERLSECRRLRFLPWDAEHQDIGKLVIDTARAGISGRKLYELLLDNYHIQLEMASQNYCLAMFTVGDTREGYSRMTEALLEIDRELALCDGLSQGKMGRECASLPEGHRFDTAIPLARAWDMDWEYVPLEEAAGRHVAEFVNLYPPGIPLLVPGELFTEEFYQKVCRYLEEGLSVQGVLPGQDRLQIKCVKRNN
ncbi:MAG: aminotransferase class I/II-fold pyridoxal phosphate-dependent enzyme [Roseburia sp.]|nr:aminotransferase class I/II-fold pyridoxal phosphate-dependent enzyme [Roseburia sp.]